jgi:hypothetical protein
MLGDGHRCRRPEEDAAVLVLPHQVSLVGLPRQYDAPSTVSLDEFGIQHQQKRTQGALTGAATPASALRIPALMRDQWKALALHPGQRDMDRLARNAAASGPLQK